jgi:hypothetical protein
MFGAELVIYRPAFVDINIGKSRLQEKGLCYNKRLEPNRGIHLIPFNRLNSE